MKRRYENPVLEIVRFGAEDVVVCSDNTPLDDTPEDPNEEP